MTTSDGAARALAKLQDVLGEHNDVCVALARLRALAEDATPAGVWASGLLGGLQITRAAECRTQFRAVYRDALAKSRWNGFIDDRCRRRTHPAAAACGQASRGP